MGRPHDWRTKLSDAKKMTDDELKDLMIQCLVMGTTYSRKFQDSPELKVRCWELLSSDKEFEKKYQEMLHMHLKVAEEKLLTGEFLDNIPQTVDKLGNVDLARGHLRKAELEMKRLQWLLERRDSRYKPNALPLVDDGSGGLRIVVQMPEKETDDSAG